VPLVKRIIAKLHNGTIAIFRGESVVRIVYRGDRKETAEEQFDCAWL